MEEIRTPNVFDKVLTINTHSLTENNFNCNPCMYLNSLLSANYQLGEVKTEHQITCQNLGLIMKVAIKKRREAYFRRACATGEHTGVILLFNHSPCQRETIARNNVSSMHIILAGFLLLQ